MTSIAEKQIPLWRDFVALTKPRITLLVLITTAGGIWLAPHAPTWWAALLSIIATTMVVGAANALNCYLERDSDRHMTRTQDRPLPAGRLPASYALYFGAVLALVSLPLLAYYANLLSAFLGAFALVSYVWVYTPLKQRSSIALPVGAIPGAIPPLLGWTVATGSIDLPGLVLFGILFLWQLPHFLAIALFRKEEYARAGIKILPLVKGDAAAVWRIPVYVVALWLCSLALVPLQIAGQIYLWSALVLGAGLFVSACQGFKKADAVWARRFFLHTLLYLTLLFAALVVDVA